MIMLLSPRVSGHVFELAYLIAPLGSHHGFNLDSLFHFVEGQDGVKDYHACFVGSVKIKKEKFLDLKDVWMHIFFWICLWPREDDFVFQRVKLCYEYSFIKAMVA